jgi:PII-like signaling protein
MPVGINEMGQIGRDLLGTDPGCCPPAETTVGLPNPSGHGVRRRLCRRMTATIDGSCGCDVLAHEIVRVARAIGLPTAVVFRGVDGFTPRTDPARSAAPPLVVVVTGDPESIDDLVTGVAPVLGRSELTVEDVHEIVTACPEPSRPGARPGTGA